MLSLLQRTSTAYHPFISFIIGKLYTPMTIEPTTLLNTLLLQGKRCHLNKSLLADIKYLHSMLFHCGSLKIFLCLIGDEVGVSWINHYISVLFLALWRGKNNFFLVSEQFFFGLMKASAITTCPPLTSW